MVIPSPLIGAMLPRIAAERARRLDMGNQAAMDIVYIEGLEIETIIGINDWERTTRQKVRLDLEMASETKKAAASEKIEDALDYKSVSKRLIAFVEASEFLLVETLAERIAEIVMTEFQVPWLRLKLGKPGAVTGAKEVGVIIERGAAP